MSFDSPVLKDSAYIRQHDECSGFKDKLIPAGYCMYRAASLKSMFFFADFVRHVWSNARALNPDSFPAESRRTIGSVGRKLQTQKKVKVMLDYAKKRYMSKLSKTMNESSLKRTEELMERGLARLHESKLQVIGAHNDPAISNKILDGSYRDAAAAQKQLCYMPEEAGHTWP